MSDIRYLTDHFEPKIRRIKEIGAPLNFVFITDEHNRLNYNSYQRANPGKPAWGELGIHAVESIRYLIERCPEISFVVSGGDVGDDYNPSPAMMRESFRELMDALYSLPVPVHCCIGNHDDGIGNAIDWGWDTKEHAVLPEELHSLFMKYNPTKENYYYVDDEQNGFRYIFLNTCDKPYFLDETGQYPFGWRLEISDRQARWLENDALKTGKRILVFSHSPLHNAGIFGTGDPIKPYDDCLNGPRAYYAVKQTPTVAAMLCGHVHFDNLFYDDGILMLTSLCSFTQKWSPACPDRTCGTLTETAFDVISVRDNVLYATRFGAGEDRQAMLLR